MDSRFFFLREPRSRSQLQGRLHTLFPPAQNHSCFHDGFGDGGHRNHASVGLVASASTSVESLPPPSRARFETQHLNSCSDICLRIFFLLECCAGEGLSDHQLRWCFGTYVKVRNVFWISVTNRPDAANVSAEDELQNTDMTRLLEQVAELPTDSVRMRKKPSGNWNSANGSLGVLERKSPLDRSATAHYVAPLWSHSCRRVTVTPSRSSLVSDEKECNKRHTIIWTKASNHWFLEQKKILFTWVSSVHVIEHQAKTSQADLIALSFARRIFLTREPCRKNLADSFSYRKHILIIQDSLCCSILLLCVSQLHLT